MKAKIEMEIRPFTVPNFAAASTEGHEALPVPLTDLDPTTLDALCNEFRNTVFEKAGKRPPPECIAEPKPHEVVSVDASSMDAVYIDGELARVACSNQAYVELLSLAGCDVEIRDVDEVWFKGRDCLYPEKLKDVVFAD